MTTLCGSRLALRAPKLGCLLACPGSIFHFPARVSSSNPSRNRERCVYNSYPYFDVIIIGGGASGLMCAWIAGQRGRRVLVLEGANKVGKKILMSGGGRCNFTNLEVTAENYVSANPHFCKSALARYTQWDFIALVEKHRIAYHERKWGQLFCDNSAREILAMLLYECDQAGVTIRTDCRVDKLVTNQGFQLHT